MLAWTWTWIHLQLDARAYLQSIMIWLSQQVRSWQVFHVSAWVARVQREAVWEMAEESTVALARRSWVRTARQAPAQHRDSVVVVLACVSVTVLLERVSHASVLSFFAMQMFL